MGTRPPAPNSCEGLSPTSDLTVPMATHFEVRTTVANEADAERLADLMMTRRLAACVQVLPITSTYRWQGKVHRDPELLLMAKTTAERFPALQEAVLAAHPYDEPELIAVPIVAGSPSYLAWIDSEVADLTEGEPAEDHP